MEYFAALIGNAFRAILVHFPTPDSVPNIGPTSADQESGNIILSPNANKSLKLGPNHLFKRLVQLPPIVPTHEATHFQFYVAQNRADDQTRD